MSRPSDVVIVGGGVIGLSIAWRLACAEVGVTLIDRRAVGREASWAGAGLIAANGEHLRTNPTVELRSWNRGAVRRVVRVAPRRNRHRQRLSTERRCGRRAQ